MTMTIEIAPAGLKAHEAANIFPMIIGEEHEALKGNIKQHGVQVPIIKYGEKILDGRNRYRICEELNREGATFKEVDETGAVISEGPYTCPCTEFTGTEQQALEFVLSINFHRRHMSSSQKAAVAVKAHLLGKKYNNRARRAGEILPEGQEGLGIPTTGDIAQYLSRLAGTNRTYIFRALRIGTANPRLLDRAILGELNLNQALAEVEAAEAAAAATENGEAAAEVPEGAPSDADGNAVPEDLYPIFKAADLYKQVQKTLRTLKTEIETIAESPGGKGLVETELKAMVKTLEKNLAENKPHKVCPVCNGDGGDPEHPSRQCPCCKRAKYVTKAQYKLWQQQAEGQAPAEETDEPESDGPVETEAEEV